MTAPLCCQNGKVGITRAVPPLKALKSLLLETTNLRQSIPRSTGSRWPLLTNRSQDVWSEVERDCRSAPWLSVPEIWCHKLCSVPFYSWNVCCQLETPTSSTRLVWVLQLSMAQQQCGQYLHSGDAEAWLAQRGFSPFSPAIPLFPSLKETPPHSPAFALILLYSESQ